MGGGDEKQVQTQQSSTTNPWEPAQPLLQSILGSLGGQSTAVTGNQATALNNLNTAAAGIPNLSPELTNVVSGALNTSTAPSSGMLMDAINTYRGNIGRTASGAELNPYDTPGFSTAIDRMTADITKNVKGGYAASGRDPYGAGSFAGSLGKGITDAVAPVIQSQYNTNKQNQMGAASNLFSAEGATAGGLTQQQMQQLAAQFQGLQGAGALPGLLTGAAQAQLGAANAQYGQPYGNIGMLSNSVIPIAGLGGQSEGSGTSTQTSSKSLLSNILGAGTGLAGIYGSLGGASGIASALGPLLALSDERVKEDIEPVGETNDGQTLYSYRYIGDPEPRVGLLAQEVEKRDPGAVVEIGGIKAVNYKRALAGSKIGMLKMAA